MTHDGLGHYLSQMIQKAPGPTADIAGTLRDTSTNVVVNFLPVGSEMATKWYVEQIARRRVRLRELHPRVHRARGVLAPAGSRSAGLPMVGDDVKSQVGATIIHRVLTRLFMDRGVRLDRTSQLNFGGNTDFYNMLERDRLTSKKISKTDSVRSQLGSRAAGRRRPHRPERLRAVARRTASGRTSASRAVASAISRSTSS